VSWWHWLGVCVALSSMYGAVCGLDRLERWADRRRHARRSAQARRARARAHGRPPKISRDEFRNGVRARLFELAEDDGVRAVVAGIEYVHRASAS
jgi:hypothetical protein